MVSKDSLQKGIDVIQTHGPKYASHIIQILEKFLKRYKPPLYFI